METLVHLLLAALMLRTMTKPHKLDQTHDCELNEDLLYEMNGVILVRGVIVWQESFAKNAIKTNFSVGRL